MASARSELTVRDDVAHMYKEQMAKIKEQAEKLEQSKQEQKTDVKIETKPQVSEETKVEVKPQESTEVQPALDIETRAIAKGWVPKDKFTGNPDDWVDAKEFIRVGSLFERISSLNGELKSLKETQQQTIEHLANTRKAAYEQALKDLETKKIKAVEEANTEEFRHLESQTQTLREQQSKDPIISRQPVQKQESTNLSEDDKKSIDDFMSRNKEWYSKEDTEEHIAMTLSAQAIDRALMAQTNRFKKPVNVKEHFKALEDTMRKLYPAKFSNPAKDMPSMVGKSTSNESERSSSDFVSKLTPYQLTIGHKLEKSSKGKYTLEMYAKDLELQKQIKR